MRAGDCRHFNGMANDRCNNSVNYDELTNKGEFNIPCLKNRFDGDEREVATCSKFHALTEREQEQHDREAKIRAEFTMTAVALCVMDSEKKGWRGPKLQNSDISGEVQCPKCGKKIRYNRANLNGHIMGACETENCLQWIQ